MRWSKGGSRAATGGSDAAGAAHPPEGCVDTGDPAGDLPAANDAARIQALLDRLSEARLTVSADLSAAAGALDGGRADVAADLIAGARGELAQLRAATRRRESAPSPFPRKVPEQQRARPRHRLARALAGATALAVAIAVVPQLAGGRGHPSNAAAGVTGVEQSPDIRLASSEFTVLSQRLLAADAAPASIMAAERTWQGAVTGSLPSASSQPATAAAVVIMLRQEQGLLLASPALRAPANRSLATSLAASSQSLLSQLRQLADPQVLAILPTVLKVLPLPGPATAPTAGGTPSPETTTGPTGGAGSTGTPTGPSTGATNPSAPTQPTQPTQATQPSGAPPSNGPLPLPDPGKVLPVPLPSTLGQLTGGGTDSGSLGQTVGSVLNGLGLGG